jgi:hypothetical protein
LTSGSARTSTVDDACAWFNSKGAITGQPSTRAVTDGKLVVTGYARELNIGADGNVSEARTELTGRTPTNSNIVKAGDGHQGAGPQSNVCVGILSVTHTRSTHGFITKGHVFGKVGGGWVGVASNTEVRNKGIALP